MKIISLDYDGTFTDNPVFWSNFVRLAEKAKYKVICISARTDNDSNRELLAMTLPRSVDFFLTSHNPKKEWAEKRAIIVDIWIEDNPIALFESDVPSARVLDEIAT